ncbi:MAG: aminodeoxychorismate lyase [Betaproteobacteria bacterium]|nr:aminodeoxychorismate lyase [Betaproteobacteria bacterium]
MLVNGKLGNLIGIRDRGLLYGDGVFRTLRASNGRALHWPLHYRKLQHDCAALGIVCPDVALLSAELNDLLVQHPDGVVKLIVTRGEGMRGYAPPVQSMPARIWDVSPMPGYPADWARYGIKARLCQLRLSQQPRLAGIKHLNRLENVLAAAEWDDADIAEGVLLDAQGNVIEGTRCNLFMVRDGELLTPDLSRCGVAGVQRERVMEWAAKHNVPCRVEQFGLAELLAADEVFLVNSVIGLWPVRELQSRTWSHCPVAMQAQKGLAHALD